VEQVEAAEGFCLDPARERITVGISPPPVWGVELSCERFR
jgi:hypothetical protein